MSDAASPTLDLARALIARRSLTPDDAGCQTILAARLGPLGFLALPALVVNPYRPNRIEPREFRNPELTNWSILFR